MTYLPTAYLTYLWNEAERGPEMVPNSYSWDSGPLSGPLAFKCYARLLCTYFTQFQLQRDILSVTHAPSSPLRKVKKTHLGTWVCDNGMVWYGMVWYGGRLCTLYHGCLRVSSFASHRITSHRTVSALSISISYYTYSLSLDPAIRA